MKNRTVIASIETGRLDLVSMTIPFLQAMLSGDMKAAQTLGGFAIPADCSLLKMVWLGRRLDMIGSDPEQHPWMYRAIVCRETNSMVGYISFHHKAPDPDLLEYSPFAAELGYTIEPSFRRLGYARESVLAMTEWAHRNYSVNTFMLSISPDNIPSLRLAVSLGFVRVGERMDDEDGLEYTFRLDKTL